MRHQRGASVLGVMFMVACGIAIAILAFKLIPAFTEYEEIRHELVDTVNDPDLANSSGPEIRQAFSKRAEVGGVTSITANDLDIDNNPLRLHVKYTVKVPLVANVGDYIDFDASAVSGKK
ncbi:MAG: DUF4845 domain-containing protein [Burkholderiales bacterium]|nr:DUF4845 domain-containing protein [Burkholderiales bacterium]